MNYRRTFLKLLMVALVMLFAFSSVSGFNADENIEPVSGSGQSAVISHTKTLKLMPVGAAVGIHIKTDGLLVLGTSEVMNISGEKVHPAKNMLKSGDYILKVNGEEVETTSQLMEMINDAADTSLSGENALDMEIMRDGKIKNTSLTPVETEAGIYKIGVWIRDDTQGIGTICYVDENNHFAALGHGITDIDTGYVIDVCGGGLYPANIYAIVKGEANEPGEMIGHILYGSSQKFGDVENNTGVGIHGMMRANSPYVYDESKALPVGTKEEMCIGEAVVRCQIGGEIKDYDIWISGIDFNGSSKNKDFVIEIRDEELLGKTGGIIQGMSGSPIIQDGKLVGAVTHVLVNDPTRGYGIFIENMLDAVE